VTQYRIRRAYGLMTTGVLFIVAAVAVTAWFLVRGALDDSTVLDSIVGIAVAILAIVALILNVRQPVLLTLDPVGFRGRKFKGTWRDIEDVFLRDGILGITTTANMTYEVPLKYFEVDDQRDIVTEVYGRLNEAHRYKRFEIPSE
jgi:hypothetical protein